MPWWRGLSSDTVLGSFSNHHHQVAREPRRGDRPRAEDGEEEWRGDGVRLCFP